MPFLFHVKEPKEKSSQMESNLDSSINTEDDDSLDFNFTFRRVRFCASVRQRTIMSIDDYSESERKNTWQDKEDKAEMNKKHDKMVRRFEMGKVCKRGMTYRGLECWTAKGAQKFGAKFDRLITTVMDEQDDQWKRGIENSDRLAEASMSVSMQSVLKALRMAEEDAYEALEAYKETFAEDNASDEDSMGTLSTFILQKRKERRRRSDDFKKKNQSQEKGGRKRASRRQSSLRKACMDEKKGQSNSQIIFTQSKTTRLETGRRQTSYV